VTALSATAQDMDIAPGLLAALDEAYAALRAEHPGLPRALVTVEEPHPAVVRRIACWRPGRLVTAAGVFEGRIAFGYPPPHRAVPRLLLDGPPAGILGTLVHEAAHALADARGIADTSRRGTYHNAAYRDLAEELGLDTAKDERYGWTLTAPSPALLGRYGRHLSALAAAMPGTENVERYGSSAVAGAGGTPAAPGAA
jgi:hypothetical protein